MKTTKNENIITKDTKDKQLMQYISLNNILHITQLCIYVYKRHELKRQSGMNYRKSTDGKKQNCYLI